MKVAVVLHGDAPGRDELALLDGCDAIVCADGGALPVLASGRAPTAVVGDLDSLSAAQLTRARRAGATIERHPARKDETDGELAMAHALRMRPDAVLLLGAHGGRTALFLANLKLLRRCLEAGVPATCHGRGETLRLVAAGEQWVLGGEVGARGATLNLLALDGDAVVDLRGLAWSGDAVALAQSGARGVSNPVRSGRARVAVRRGLVLAILEPAPPSRTQARAAPRRAAAGHRGRTRQRRPSTSAR